MKYAIGKRINSQDIKNFRKQFRLTQKDLAELLCVSIKTVEKWEVSNKDITGPEVTALTLIRNNPALLDTLKVEKNHQKIRYYYMDGNYISTIIDVDYAQRTVRYKNYTNDINARAFGKKDFVTFDDYEAFIEERCFPKGRDMMKIELEKLDIPFYDPYLILEKTHGRVEGDNYWLMKEELG